MFAYLMLIVSITAASVLDSIHEIKDQGIVTERKQNAESIEKEQHDTDIKAEIRMLREVMNEERKTVQKQMEGFELIIHSCEEKQKETDIAVAKLKAIIAAQEEKLKHMELQISELKDNVNKKESHIDQLDKLLKVQNDNVIQLQTELYNIKSENFDIMKESAIDASTDHLIAKPEKETSDKSNKIGANTTTGMFANVPNPYDMVLNGSHRSMLSSFKRQLKVQRQATPSPNEGMAFSAYLSHYTNHMGKGTIIKCDQIILNEGNGYNPATGLFTAPENGVYLLTFFINAYTNNKRTDVKLVVNSRNIVDAIIRPRGGNHDVMGGNTAIVRLNRGENVWLETFYNLDSELSSNDDFRFTTFSGVLLY